MTTSELEGAVSGFSLSTIATLLIVILLLSLIRIRYRKGLRNIPGPFLASISPLDRIVTTARGHQFQNHIRYHEQYGSIVRLGPNHVSLSNAEHIPTIYGIATKYHKVSFLPPVSFYTSCLTSKIVRVLLHVRRQDTSWPDCTNSLLRAR